MLKHINVEIFFFKQKTAYEVSECDWSTEVCSSGGAGVRCEGVGLVCGVCVWGWCAG